MSGANKTKEPDNLFKEYKNKYDPFFFFIRKLSLVQFGIFPLENDRDIFI